MTVGEVYIWLQYRKKNGPMNDLRRFDRPAAMINALVSNVTGGKTKIVDLMPWGDKEEAPADLTQIIELFGGVNVGKKSR